MPTPSRGVATSHPRRPAAGQGDIDILQGEILHRVAGNAIDEHTNALGSRYVDVLDRDVAQHARRLRLIAGPECLQARAEPHADRHGDAVHRDVGKDHVVQERTVDRVEGDAAQQRVANLTVTDADVLEIADRFRAELDGVAAGLKFAAGDGDVAAGYGLVAFRQMASSPVLMSQSRILTNSQESVSMPSLLARPRLRIVSRSAATFLHWKKCIVHAPELRRLTSLTVTSVQRTQRTRKGRIVYFSCAAFTAAPWPSMVPAPSMPTCLPSTVTMSAVTHRLVDAIDERIGVAIVGGVGAAEDDGTGIEMECDAILELDRAGKVATAGNMTVPPPSALHVSMAFCSAAVLSVVPSPTAPESRTERNAAGRGERAHEREEA